MSELLDKYNPQGEMVIYQTEDGKASVDVMLENETVWLPTSQIALLYGKEESNIRRHIINIFEDGELSRENNVHFLHVNGVKKPVPFYNLDVVIAVGYRVRSQRGTQFRKWLSGIGQCRKYLSRRGSRQSDCGVPQVPSTCFNAGRTSLLRFAESNRGNNKEEKMNLL